MRLFDTDYRGHTVFGVFVNQISRVKKREPSLGLTQAVK